MRKLCDEEKQDSLEKLLGLGESSVHKNYYSILQEKLKSLEEAEHNLRVLFDNSYDGVVISNFEGKILDVNGRMLELYECTREQAVALRIEDISDAAMDNRTIKDYLSRTMSGEFVVFEWSARRPGNGSVFPVVVALRRIYWYGQYVVMATVQDITLRKQNEKALENALHQLEKVNNNLEDIVHERTAQLEKVNQELKEKIGQLEMAQAELIRSEKLASLGELVAGVAHEINTPVGVSVTAASYLESQIQELKLKISDSELPKEISKYMDKSADIARIILSNLTRAANLVKSFKQVSVDRSNDMVRTFDLSEYMDEIIMSLMPNVKKTGHKIQNRIERGILIKGYPGAISQIITNLLTNALNHAFLPGCSGTVEISSVVAEGSVCISFKDDGIGMDEQIMKRMYDPFFTTKRNSGGTGLGLFIVHNLVTYQLKGKLECESRQGEGTEFRITIPVNMKQ